MLARDAGDAIDRLVDTLADVSVTRPRDASPQKVRGGGARATGRSPQVSDPTWATMASWEAEADRAVWWLVGGWREDGRGRPEEHGGFVQRVAAMLDRFDPADANVVLELVDNLRGISPTSPDAWRRHIRAVGTWLHGAVTVLHDGWQTAYRARLVQKLPGVDVEDEAADRECTWLLSELRELLGPLIREADAVAHAPAKPQDLISCKGACEGANLAKYRRLERCDRCRRAELRAEAQRQELSG
jgi:hypothetical protein